MQTYTGHFVFYATSFCVRIFSKDCLMSNFVVVFQCLIFLSELGACRGAVSVAHMVLVGLDLVAGRVTSKKESQKKVEKRGEQFFRVDACRTIL